MFKKIGPEFDCVTFKYSRGKMIMNGLLGFVPILILLITLQVLAESEYHNILNVWIGSPLPAVYAIFAFILKNISRFIIAKIAY